MEKALAFDSEDIAGVIEDLDVLRARFAELFERARAEYLRVGAGLSGDKEAEAVLDAFRDPEGRESFYAFYREIEELYEILSPDPFLRPYVDEYARLSSIYLLLRASFEPHLPVGKSFLRKTAELVQERTHTGEILDPDEIYVLDEGVIDALADPDKPDTVKVFNLIKALEAQASTKGSQAPYLLSIGERAQKVADAYQQRQLSIEDALKELTRLLSEAEVAERERRETDLSIEAFFVFWTLKEQGVDGAAEVGRSAEAAFSANPHWRQAAEQEREIRKSLYLELVPRLGVDQSTTVVDHLLDVLRRSGV